MTGHADSCIIYADVHLLALKTSIGLVKWGSSQAGKYSGSGQARLHLGGPQQTMKVCLRSHGHQCNCVKVTNAASCNCQRRSAVLIERSTAHSSNVTSFFTPRAESGRAGLDCGWLWTRLSVARPGLTQPCFGSGLAGVFRPVHISSWDDHSSDQLLQKSNRVNMQLSCLHDY